MITTLTIAFHANQSDLIELPPISACYFDPTLDPTADNVGQHQIPATDSRPMSVAVPSSIIEYKFGHPSLKQIYSEFIRHFCAATTTT